MAISLSRQELYDLVWSKPMTHVSKELGMSDVMLGKICREKNVPRPPRGYWANLLTGKNKSRYVKPPLPGIGTKGLNFWTTLEFEHEAREAARTDKFDPKDFSVPIPPGPEFPEPLAAFRARLDTTMPATVEPSKMKSLHPLVQRLADRDAEKARDAKRSSWDKSEYQDKEGAYLLQSINGLVQNCANLGIKPEISGRVHLRLSLGFRYGGSFRMHVERPTDWMGRKVPGKKAVYKFAWGQDWEVRDPKNQKSYETFGAKEIRELILDQIVDGEKSYREHAQRFYSWHVSSRNELLAKHQEKIEKAAQEKREAIEQMLAMRIEMMDTALESMRKSDQVRELIAIMKTKSEAAKHPIEGLERWIGWASHHANTLDPRNMSAHHFEQWIAKFKLRD